MIANVPHQDSLTLSSTRSINSCDIRKFVFWIFSISGLTACICPLLLAATNTPSEPVTEISISFAAFRPLISSMIKSDSSYSEANAMLVASPGSRNPDNPLWMSVFRFTMSIQSGTGCLYSFKTVSVI